ncbi:MAG: response regulator [Selenomonadaceae bacterium]|nr:response regulator [Selenomonadaceae bacterium]
MDTEQSKLMKEFIIGAVIVLTILIFGTFWMGNSVSEDNSTAVRTVSLMYLDELAGRREQVIAGKLNDYIKDMSTALDLLTNENLSSVDNLRGYQAKMKQIYGLEKFAFVDTEGTIYTTRGIRNDIDKYDFDYKTLTETKIFIKNLHGNSKKIVIAMPADNLPFAGKTLVACFMEMDMNNLLEGVSIQSLGNNSTFCNIYTEEGISLTNIVLGGLSSEGNLLKAMETAKFEKGYSLDKLKKDFASSSKGFVAFTYDGIQETIYYVPVNGTDWMLTYLIRESVISEQVGEITEGIVFRSLIHSVLTALVLVGMFVAIIIQLRRTAKAQLEKETADAENRVKQQELEEQLALQEELLAQEQYKTQQDNMIKALASDYRSVYYVNLAADDGICYLSDPELDHTINESEHFTFSEFFTEYAKLYVTEEYRAEFLNFIHPKSIREGLKSNPVMNYRYLVRKKGVHRYEMIRIAGVKKTADSEHIIQVVGVGFTDIDSEMRESMAKSLALSDALKTAEEASKAKTAFLSSMSHEIRTPMNAIIGLDNLALHEPGISDTTRNYLEKIGTSAQHLLSLINDILDMSRIESGRMTVRNEEFSFPKLIEQINTIFSGQCKENKLEYNCHVNGHVGEYYIGDSTKLRQVLINILGNAVKFTHEGGKVDFIVEKTAEFDGNSTIRFVVKDTGIGMSKEYLPKIFDTFSQEDSTATNKYGSSGLGMAITKSIVDMMNGKIEVDSEKGVGTTFTVTVTLINSDKENSAKQDDVEFHPHEMNVLVIDDDPIACDHAKLVLEKAGIAADTVLTGKEALEMIKLRHARRESYNLIIVDWQMPEMDGVEVTRRIREIIGNESAIIILTAYNWDDVADEAIAAGVDSFIAKPLFSGALLDEFKKVFKKKNLGSTEKIKKAELKGRRILLAEDMPVNAEIMLMVLQMREMETELAENGRIALEMFEKSPEGYYDAILMDMRMPEMDGLEATQRIRALDRPDAKSIPIIALTANAFDEDVQRSLQAGLNAHLSKPVEPEVLFETLENMIRN